MKKVYCEDCKYYKSKNVYYENCVVSCHHTNNLIDSYKSKKSIFKETPCQKNKNNNCKDYTKGVSFYQIKEDISLLISTLLFIVIGVLMIYNGKYVGIISFLFGVGFLYKTLKSSRLI